MIIYQKGKERNNPDIQLIILPLITNQFKALQMKKKSMIIEALIIIIGPIGGYIGYYDNITCKPTQAGFWFIITIGISIGVVITQLLYSRKDRKKNKAIIGDIKEKQSDSDLNI